jgi:hypothetical protein
MDAMIKNDDGEKSELMKLFDEIAAGRSSSQDSDEVNRQSPERSAAEHARQVTAALREAWGFGPEVPAATPPPPQTHCVRAASGCERSNGRSFMG